MPAPLISKDEVIARLFVVFREHGYNGATLAELAEKTGLGKSSLYHYFPGGKEEMANSVLDYVATLLTTQVLAPLREPGKPNKRLQKMVTILDNVYAGGKNACVLGNLAMGDSKRLFHKRLQKSFSTWIEGLESLAIEAGFTKRDARQRAEDVVISIEGGILVTGALGDLRVFHRILSNVQNTLLGTKSL